MPLQADLSVPHTFNPLRVFVSHSEKGDLDEESKRAVKTIKEICLIPVHPKGASPHDVETDYKNILHDCSIIVVILGRKYSLNVEKEFNYARKNKIDCLLFIKNCRKEKRLKEKIEELYSRFVTYDHFNDLEELETKVKKSIMKLLSERFRSGKRTENVVRKFIHDLDIIEFIEPIESGEYRFRNHSNWGTDEERSGIHY